VRFLTIHYMALQRCEAIRQVLSVKYCHLWDLGSVESFTSEVRGEVPTRNAFCVFWRPQNALLHLYADALSSSNSVSCHITYQVRITYTVLSFVSRDTGGCIKWQTVLLYLVVVTRLMSFRLVGFNTAYVA